MTHLILELAPLILLTASIAVCVQVFLSLKKDIFGLTAVLKRQREEQAASIEALEAQVDWLKKRLEDAEERTGVLVPPQAPRSGFNLSKRSQAIRMARVGETPENIAAALSLPRREVELLLKVQKIVLSSAAAATSSQPAHASAELPHHRTTPASSRSA